MNHELSAREALLRLAGIAAQTDLRGFRRLTWRFFQQGSPYVPTWAGDAMCEHVQAWILGQIDRLGIEVPPGSGKTSIASICGPVWSWLRDPSSRWMCGSYDLVYAARLNRKRRRLVLEPAVRALTRPGYDLVRGEKAATFFQNDRGGWMAAVSPDGGVTTGEHSSHMGLDDLVKASNATGQKFKEIAAFISTALMSRFRDQNNPKIMHVAQRLGRGDPADVLYDKGPLRVAGEEDRGPLFNDFEVLRIPAEYDPKRSKVTVLGFRDPRTYEGESFSKERYDSAHFAAKRKGLTNRVFEEQYNQRVESTTGGMFRREWFQFWHVRPDLSQATWASFTDCTFRGGVGADFVVIQVWAAVGGIAYLMDQIRGQLGFIETCAALTEMTQRWPQCGRWMVEASRAANGDAVVDAMRRQIPGVVGVSYEKGQTKEARAKAALPMAEGKQICVPDPAVAPWVVEWLDEHCAFTGADGQQDDQVDASSGALNYLRGVVMEGPSRPAAAAGGGGTAIPKKRERMGW